MVETTLERLPKRRDLRPQPALREVGQHDRVGRALHKRVEHRAAGDAEDVGRRAAVWGVAVIDDSEPEPLVVADEMRPRGRNAGWQCRFPRG